MHRTLLMFVAAALVATPASAQNEVVDAPAGNAANNVAVPDTDAAGAANSTNLAEPVDAIPVDTDVAVEDVDSDADSDRGFPWGLIGLVGLLGLLGRRRNS